MWFCRGVFGLLFLVLLVVGCLGADPDLRVVSVLVGMPRSLTPASGLVSCKMEPLGAYFAAGWGLAALRIFR